METTGCVCGLDTGASIFGTGSWDSIGLGFRVEGSTIRIPSIVVPF